MHGAASYIDQLQNSLICRIRTHGLPERLKAHSAGGSHSHHQSQDSIKKTVESYVVSSNGWGGGGGSKKWNVKEAEPSSTAMLL